MSLHSALLQLDSIIPFLYSFLFLVSIGVFKKHSSLSLIVVILGLAEFAMHSITMPFLNFLDGDDIPYYMAMALWVGVWVAIDVFIIYILQKTHFWLKINKGPELIFVQSAYFGLIVLLSINYINRMLIKSDAIELIYNLGIPSINLSIAGYLLFALLKQMEFKWKPQA